MITALIPNFKKLFSSFKKCTDKPNYLPSYDKSLQGIHEAFKWIEQRKLWLTTWAVKVSPSCPQLAKISFQIPHWHDSKKLIAEWFKGHYVCCEWVRCQDFVLCEVVDSSLNLRFEWHEPVGKIIAKPLLSNRPETPVLERHMFAIKLD